MLCTKRLCSSHRRCVTERLRVVAEMGAGAWCRAGCIRACVASDNDAAAALDWCIEHADEIAAAPAAAPDASSAEASGGGSDDQALLYVVIAPRSVEFNQDRGFQARFYLNLLCVNRPRKGLT